MGITTVATGGAIARERIGPKATRPRTRLRYSSRVRLCVGTPTVSEPRSCNPVFTSASTGRDGDSSVAPRVAHVVRTVDVTNVVKERRAESCHDSGRGRSRGTIHHQAAFDQHGLGQTRHPCVMDSDHGSLTHPDQQVPQPGVAPSA